MVGSHRLAYSLKQETKFYALVEVAQGLTNHLSSGFESERTLTIEDQFCSHEITDFAWEKWTHGVVYKALVFLDLERNEIEYLSTSENYLVSLISKYSILKGDESN